MLKHTLTAAALSIAATGALAEAHTAMTSEDIVAMEGDLIRTRDITGGNIWTTNQADDEGMEWEGGAYQDAWDDSWNEIGEIEDIILDRSGQMIGIVAEVGGFLDIGDKHVVIPVGDLNLAPVDDATYTFITRLNEEQLEALPGVDEGWWD